MTEINYLMAFVAPAIALIGIFIALRNRKKYLIRFDRLYTLDLFGNSSGPFVLIYNNDATQSYCEMHLSRISFTNTGNQTIQGRDISNDDPFKIIWSDSDIVDVIINAKTNNIPSLTLKNRNSKSVEFTFQYLSPKEKFEILLYHSTPKLSINVSGQAANIARIISGSELDRKSISKFIAVLSFFWLMSILYVVWLVVCHYTSELPQGEFYSHALTIAILVLVVGGFEIPKLFRRLRSIK